MSLGFNQNRKPRVRPLPGTIHGVVRVPRSQDVTLAPPVRKRSPPVTVPRAPAPVEAPPPPVQDDVHTVYATASCDVVDVDGTRVANAGERLVLVYPMAADANDGMVTMRQKTVHPVTGQLEYRWIRVYDPNTETRFVTNFSLLP